MTIIQTSFRFRRVWFDIYTSLAMDDLDPAGWGAALYSFFQNCQYRNENLVKKKRSTAPNPARLWFRFNLLGTQVGAVVSCLAFHLWGPWFESYRGTM